jgi:hypothetical protein
MKAKSYSSYLLHLMFVLGLFNCGCTNEKENLITAYKNSCIRNDALVSTADILKSQVVYFRLIELDEQNRQIIFQIKSYNPNNINGLQGSIDIKNPFGQSVYKSNFELNELIPPMGTITVVLDANNKIFNYKLSDLKVESNCEMIIFDNGLCIGSSSAVWCDPFTDCHNVCECDYYDCNDFSKDELRSMIERQNKNTEKINEILRKLFNYP